MNVQGIRIIAQIAMDAFYQNWRPADKFLRLEHFIYLCKAADGKIKQDEYDQPGHTKYEKRALQMPL